MTTKKKRTKITTQQLEHITDDLREIINDHINTHNMSVHGFAKMCGVHPNQMYLFLNSDRGLNLTTVQRIGEVINK